MDTEELLRKDERLHWAGAILRSGMIRTCKREWEAYQGIGKDIMVDSHGLKKSHLLEGEPDISPFHAMNSAWKETK